MNVTYNCNNISVFTYTLHIAWNPIVNSADVHGFQIRLLPTFELLKYMRKRDLRSQNVKINIKVANGGKSH